MYKLIMREVKTWIGVLSLCALIVLLLVFLFESFQEIFLLMSRDSEIYSYSELMDAVSASTLVGLCAAGIPFSLIWVFDLHKTFCKSVSSIDQKEA